MTNRSWCRIQAAATAGGPAEIFIYDVIGSWLFDTDAGSIARQIADLDAGELRVRINSPGGDAFDGVAIFNALRAHDAQVTTIVDGLAASAASVIAMAGDEVVMGPGSQLMVHSPWMVTDGDAAELRKDADRLDKMTDSLIEVYSARAGGGADQWRALLEAETWMTADEAVAAGLADRVDAREAPEASARARAWNFKNFRYAGRDAAPAPRIPSAEAVEVPTRKEGEMPTVLESLSKRLGIAEDADEATALAALDEVLAEQTDAGESGEPRAAAPADIPAALEAKGMVAVDKATLDELRAGAKAGAEARAEQEDAERARIVQSHVDRGAITPAQRDHYVALMAADRGTTEQLLDAIPANSYPVAEIGHDADGVEGRKDDAAERMNAAADQAGFIGRMNP